MSNLLFVDETPPGWRERLRAAVEENPDECAEKLAHTAVSELPASKCRSLLTVYAQAEIKDLQRERARKVEQQARDSVRKRQEKRQQKEQEKWQADDRAEALRQRDSAFADLYANPHDLSYTLPDMNFYSCDNFRQWCINEMGLEAFAAWREKRDSATERRERDNPSPIAQAFEAAKKFVEDLSTKIRFEITTELLDSHFATGDGSTVTWREANVSQHEQRIEMLTKMVAGTAETAAMHTRAITMIKESGAETLGQLEHVAAA